MRAPVGKENEEGGQHGRIKESEDLVFKGMGEGRKKRGFPSEYPPAFNPLPPSLRPHPLPSFSNPLLEDEL